MNKKLLSNHWFWLISVFSIYTIYDIYDHIARPGSVFEEYPLQWSLFSILSQLSIFLILFGSIWIMEKIVKRPFFLIDFAGIILAVAWHVYIAGPIINQLLFPFAPLTFFFHPILPGILIGVYMVIRGILFLRKKLRKNSSE